ASARTRSTSPREIRSSRSRRKTAPTASCRRRGASRGSTASSLPEGQRMGTGQCPVKGYNRERRDLIIAGHARPSFIVSHELPLDEAPIGYDKFDKREGGWTKVLLHQAA